MTTQRIALVQVQDGSWKRPDCECALHLYDGVGGPLEPHWHPCSLHADLDAELGLPGTEVEPLCLALMPIKNGYLAFSEWGASSGATEELAIDAAVQVDAIWRKIRRRMKAEEAQAS